MMMNVLGVLVSRIYGFSNGCASSIAVHLIICFLKLLAKRIFLGNFNNLAMGILNRSGANALWIYRLHGNNSLPLFIDLIKNKARCCNVPMGIYCFDGDSVSIV